MTHLVKQLRELTSSSSTGGFPLFRLPSDSKIKIIKDPSSYHKSLIEGIGKARERVVLATLYLGNGTLESEVVAALSSALEAHPSMTAHVHMDCLRGLRIMQGSTTGANGIPPEGKADEPAPVRHSVAMITPLLERFGDRVLLSLYHTPHLRGVKKGFLPNRWNETLSVSHVKAAVFDNDVILTGANLSDTYFTTRQDRYIHFSNVPELADYFAGLLTTLATSGSLIVNKKTDAVPESHVLDPEWDMNWVGIQHRSAPYHPFLGPGSVEDFLDHFSDRIRSFRNAQVAKAAEAMEDTENNSESSQSGPSYVMPTLQMADFGVSDDEDVFDAMVNAHGELYLASPYFNFAPGYEETIINADNKVHIITASEQCHGWAGAKGVSSAIPKAYTHLQGQFLTRAQASGREKKLFMSEFDKAGWTFHAKGVWAPKGLATVIGSSNFGWRSAKRDLEAGIVLVTEDELLAKEIEAERRSLWHPAQPVEAKTSIDRASGISTWVRLASGLIQSYL